MTFHGQVPCAGHDASGQTRSGREVARSKTSSARGLYHIRSSRQLGGCMGVASIDPRHRACSSETVESVRSDQREQLIALLAAVENQQKCALLPGDDVGLITVARHHRLSPLLSATCGGMLRPPLVEAFRRDRVVTLARSMILRGVAEECVRALVAEGIQTIVLKGLAYEEYLYDLAGVRPTADVDLLVPNGDRRRAFAVLDRLGFEPRAAA